MFVYFHCGSNTGYAIEPLEKTFFRMAVKIAGSDSNVHFGYPDLHKGMPRWLPNGFKNVIQFDAKDASVENRRFIADYFRSHKIECAFGFDQPVGRPVYRAMRAGGARTLITYWGAPMSSLNHGLKLLLKRLEVRLRSKPDHFIFESNAMADTAIYGRGISSKAVSVVRLAVDTERFRPDETNASYAHRAFGIPEERKIVFYSGHMEERKGVHVIVKAAVELITRQRREDVHFLILGNRNGEERRFSPLHEGTAAEDHITFGGYRSDVPAILQSCYLGTIASTGWDSFPRSSLEMAAAGLPLVVSSLQGLKETIVPEQTGLFFEPGDHEELGAKIVTLLDAPARRDAMGHNARARVLQHFTLEKQLEHLTTLVEREMSSHSGRNKPATQAALRAEHHTLN